MRFAPDRRAPDQPPARQPVDGRPVRSPSFAEVARSAAEELLDLLTSQIKLARAELSAELATRVRSGLRIALFVPAVLGAYAFAMAALAFWLADYWGRPAAFGLVAALQALIGGGGLWWAVRQERRGGKAPVLEHSTAEVRETLQKTIAAVGQSTSSAKGTTTDA